jgi:hypothetical protein
MRSFVHPVPLVLFVALVLSATLAPQLKAETLVEDKFTSSELPNRDLAANRGVWKIADGIATCTQDDSLYAKNKDHGPVIWYNVAFTDGTVKFAIKPERVKNFVFTLNGEGHVFRFVTAPTGTGVRAWPQGSHDAVSLLAAKPETPALKDDAWLQAELKFEGKRCTLKLGDFQQTFEHDAIARSKTKMGLGFAFGTLDVRDVSVVKS